MRRARFAGLLVAVPMLVGGLTVARRPVEIGSMRGRVIDTAPATLPMPHTRPMIGDLGGSSAAAPERRRSVVYVDSVARQAFDELPTMRVRMDQRNEQFVPRVLAITAGSVVEFPNNDTKFHSVFSLSKPNAFDLGRYAPGRTGSRRFDHPGLIRVFCDIHSHMSGYILVFSHRYFAVTDEEGRYAIPSVPAGTYTLNLWSEGVHADPKRVTVPDGGIAEADFLIRRP